jgi:hypothetical protein
MEVTSAFIPSPGDLTVFFKPPHSYRMSSSIAMLVSS